jgi:hypothetical protein
MKKLLIILLVLAAAGGLFAQELTWSGGVSTGLGLSSDETAKVDIFNDDSYEGNLGFLKAEYTNENIGAAVRIQGGFTDENKPDFGLHHAMLWVNLLDDIIHIRAGKMDYHIWGKNNNDWVNYSSGTGALLELKPITGLSLGASLKTNLAEGSVNTEGFFKNIAFGASYDSADLLYIAASMQLGSQELADYHKALYAFHLNAVPGLILETSGQFYNIGGEGTIDSDHWQNIGYKIIPDVFKAGVTLTEDPNVTIKVKALDVSTEDLGFSFMPWVEYAIADTPFTIYGEVKGSSVLNDDLKFTWDVKIPRITYKINDAARIQCYYLLTIPSEGSLASDDPIHKVKFNFTWYF